MNNRKPTIYIFGAGISGLATAAYCHQNGLPVKVYEATNHAGGRCRSFYDVNLGSTIDNGNHLILGGNDHIFDYLKLIGSANQLLPTELCFPFLDLRNFESWSFIPGNPKFPFWLFLPNRRIPGTSLIDYKNLWQTVKNSPNNELSENVDINSVMYKRFWEPLCNSVLNTSGNEGSSKLLCNMLKLTFFRGPKFAQPFLVPNGLSATFVDPVVNNLLQEDKRISFGARLNKLVRTDKLTDLLIGRELSIPIAENDQIVLAVTPTEIARLLPETKIPSEFSPIVNIHFKIGGITLPNNVPFLGLVNGTSQWIFQRGDILSITISNAKELVKQNADSIARVVWSEVSMVVGLDRNKIPPFRIIKERQATIAQTPKQDSLRPDSLTQWKNIHIAGDWTDTGLPATIESSIKSARNVCNNILNNI